MEDTSASPTNGAYSVLKLREGAPRDLVDETYWFLVRKLRFGVVDDVEELRLLDQLNAAYETIARNGVQRLSQPARNGTRRRWARREGRWQQPAPDPYALLFVTEDADAEIAQLSAKVLAGRPPSHMNRDEWNRTLAEAAAKLSHIARERVEASSATADADQERVDPNDAVDGVAVMPSSVDVDADAKEPKPEAAQAVEGPHGAAAELVAEEQAVSTEDVAGGDRVASAAEAAIEVQNHDMATDDDGDSTTQAEDGRPKGIRALLDRVLTRSERRNEIIEAENVRLLTLREEGDSLFVPAEHDDAETAEAESDTPDSAFEARRTSGFVTFGNGNGHSSPIELTEEEELAFLIGLPADPARVRVWRRGGQFLLRQVGGPPVILGGMPLPSPIVVLEDGDEVSCDGEVMRIAVRVPSGATEDGA